jgi:hypothetical protein
MTPYQNHSENSQEQITIRGVIVMIWNLILVNYHTFYIKDNHQNLPLIFPYPNISQSLKDGIL